MTLLRPRPQSRLRAALLLSAPLALWMGCVPPLEGATCETDQNCPSAQFCSAGVCKEGARPPRAATMSAAASLGSTTASVGQSLTLTFTVTNTGTIILENIAPTSVSASGAAAGSVLSGPNPASVDRLVPGASASFTWTVTTGAAGNLTFTAAARASASDTGEAVTASATSPVVTVQRPAQLEVSLSGPTTVSRGQVFAVTMTVTNRGDAPAKNVAPTSPGVTGKTGGADATPGATPSAITIDGGANATFQLTFTESGTASGAFAVTAGAAGVDGNSNAAVTGAPASSGTITVQAPAALRISSFTIPALIGRGGTFTATLTVTNDGEAGATVVLPSPDPPAKVVTGGANASTSTALTSGSIPGGGSRTFSWAYSETGIANGTLQLTTGATGKDANTGQTISATSTASNVATVQAGGALSVTGFTIPASLSRGQGFTAVMVVTNTGGSTVTGVVPAPVPPTANATGGAAATTSTTFAPVSITAGANHTFTFNYTEGGTASGTLSFTAHATGTDSASGNAVTAADVTTNVAAVQQPAALAITAFTVQANLSRGQAFQVSLTVQNSGEASALNVVPSPNPPSLTRTGGADATTSSAPAAQTIAGGASATFTWSYAENGTGTGTLRFSTAATGTDANIGGSISSSLGNSNTANVVAPAALSVTSFTVPAAVLRGGTFTANMVVTNTGGAAAANVIPSPNPPAVTPTGGAGASSTDTLSPVTIAGGASHTFTWTFTENGADVGTLVLSAAVNGQDANSNAALNVPTASTSSLSVQNPGGLTITDYSFSRTQLSRGQAFTMSMTVQNNGGSAVNNVAPTPLQPAPAVGGGANATTATSPAAANIGAGASHTFTWSYTENGTGPGTLAFTAQAQGTESVSGNTITSPPATTAIATVQTPATLVVAAADISGPAKVSRGQQFTVQMTVRNTGQATANNVAPLTAQPTVQRTGTAQATSGTAVSPQSIAGGSSATFSWTFTENGTGTGTLKFTDGASGADANTGSTVTAPAVQSAGATTVQTPAQLGITTFTVPPVIQRATAFTLSMTVTNGGEADASLVIPFPNPPSQIPTGGVDAVTSSAPSPVTIPGAGSHTFTWSYTEDGSAPGTLHFQASVTGVDANSGASLSTPSTNTNTATVQDRADLEITSFTMPAVLSTGQAFTASVVVHNRGGTTANNVLPSPNPPTQTVTGGVSASTGTSLAPFTLAAGASHTFTWSYAESGGPGSIQLTTGATGTDAISGATVTAPQLSTGATTVQTAASLTVTSFTPSRSTINRAQVFSLSMTVTNGGQATAQNVLPTPLLPNVVTTGGAVAVNATTPPAQDIPGGGNATYTWTYFENGSGPGTIKFNGGAQGTDVNSGATVSAAAVDSSVLTVQTPALLVVTNFTATTPILRGTGLVLTLTVANAGQATATGVVPDPPAVTTTGGANATTSSTQTPTSIAGGSTATFTWSYTETGTAAGTLRFSTQANGTDVNIGSPVSTPSTNSNLVNVQEPANLVVTSFLTSPATLNRGQAFTATMTVQNQGGTTANNVLPFPSTPGFNVVSGSPGASTGTTQTPVNIAGGASRTFTWNYTENGTASGSFTLTAGATGTSAISGSTVTAPSVATPAVTVQEPAALTVASFTLPSSVTVGASFTASLTVQNTGEATANSVLPTPQTPVVTGGISATQATPPSAQVIPGGQSRTFNWTYSVGGTGPGTVQITSGAIGTDANSATPVTAADTPSNTANAATRPPPDPGATLVVSPRVAEVGGTVAVTMEVKNGGPREMRVTPPAALTLEGPAEVELVSAPPRTMEKVRVGPGETRRFEWTYRATRHGWVTFSGAAKGTVEVTSRHLTVPAPWCGGATSLLASAGLARSGRCGVALAMGGSPSATGGAGLYRYEWTPGDGLSSALEANPTATPKVAVTEYALTVTDADGCQARDVARAEVTDAPVVRLSAEGEAAAGEPVRFARALSCPGGGCADAWEFGDGRTSSMAAPVERYSAEGAYPVRYRTIDSAGCEAIAELPAIEVVGAAPHGGEP